MPNMGEVPSPMPDSNGVDTYLKTMVYVLCELGMQHFLSGRMFHGYVKLSWEQNTTPKPVKGHEHPSFERPMEKLPSNRNDV